MVERGRGGDDDIERECMRSMQRLQVNSLICTGLLFLQGERALCTSGNIDTKTPVENENGDVFSYWGKESSAQGENPSAQGKTHTRLCHLFHLAAPCNTLQHPGVQIREQHKHKTNPSLDATDLIHLHVLQIHTYKTTPSLSSDRTSRTKCKSTRSKTNTRLIRLCVHLI